MKQPKLSRLSTAVYRAYTLVKAGVEGVLIIAVSYCFIRDLCTYT